MNKTIIVAVSFIAAIALMFFLVLPKYESLKSKITEKEIKEVNFKNRNDYYKKVSEISNELKKYSQELEKIDFALPREIFLPAIYGFFQERASESGLILIDERFDSSSVPKESLAKKEYHFDLELSGSYAAFKNFLAVLEKSARIIEVENISFSSPEKSKSVFSFNMSVKFYSY
ncbi:MAG: type 4a pilus biogenesis protein PilO [Patescibacteria group bacterium]